MTTRMFMWEWQQLFRAVTSNLVEEVLKLLHVDTAANVFMLGAPDIGEETSIYFEPEACGFTPSDFIDLPRLAREKYEADPEHNLLITDPNLHKQHKASLWPKAVKEATEEILQQHDAIRGTISFCGFPVLLNNHWVFPVIQLDRQEYERNYRLETNNHEVTPRRKVRLARSFLEAVIWQVLQETHRELLSPSKGGSYRLANPERVLEDAASVLLSSVRSRVNEMGGEFLELANIISSERYEGGGSSGRLILARRNHPDVKAYIQLEVPIKISDFRGIRKLLEVSSNKMALLCDGEGVWGLGSPLPSYKSKQEDLFELRFTGHYAWELAHAEQVMLTSKYRQPRLPRERFDEAQFRDHVNRLFANAIPDQLVEAVRAAVEQRHGTMLVITPNAETEANRLKAQSTLVVPQSVTENIVAHISSVDGAMLIAPEGTLHAFGVILDGYASANGTPSRGARYNSAIRYVDGQRKQEIPCLALIVSEDGYVDLYPQLKPRVSRNWIDELLRALEEQAQGEFNSDRAWSVLTRLRQLRFYLLEEDIERANVAKNIVVELLHEHRQAEAARHSSGYIIPQFNDFAFNPEMTQEYYLPKE